MNVCDSCGIVAPRPGLPCEGCGATATRKAPERRGALYFVSVAAQFQCRGCGRLAPLDQVDLGGLARCELCGLTQAFDPGVWRDALAFAHGVGDLAGGEGLHPDPRWAIAATNPHHDVGTGHALEPLALGGSARVGGLEVLRSLRFAAAPGHPPCDACHAPLQVDVPHEGRLHTRCGECGVSGTYEVPAAVLGACRGLRGVLSPLGRDGLRDARTVDAAGVVGLSCPGCGAPLRPPGAGRTAECAFCHLVSRLPGESAGGSGVERAPDRQWLVFSGPSPRRQVLLQGGPAVAIGDVPTLPGSLLRSMLLSLVVAGGMAVVTGIALFVLLRTGLVPIAVLLQRW